MDAIFLDFPKAFNTVPHQRLLVKLTGEGIGGKVLQWRDDAYVFSSMVANRHGPPSRAAFRKKATWANAFCLLL